MKRTIFGTYDIRGRIPHDFTIDDTLLISRAILVYFRLHKKELSAIVIGRDGRSTSAAIAKQIKQAAAEFGIAVHDLGLCPSPVLYYALHTSSITSGIMITASHNPTEYNGFKIRLNRKPVWGKQLEQICTLTREQASPPCTYQSTAHIAKSCYIPDLAQSFTHLKSRPIHAIIDAGNGAAGPTVASIINALALPNVTLINQQPDSTFPSHQPDPSKKENLSELIAMIKHANTPTIGLALDGDGDRLAVILEDGTHLTGDDILALLCRPVLAARPNSHVVCDIKSSSRLTKTVTSLGSTCHLAPCGHPFIQSEMNKHRALLGGEVSGHLFFNDRYHGFDDGIYALLRVLELRQQHGSLILQFNTLSPAYASAEKRIACQNKNKIVNRAQQRAALLAGARLTTTDGIRAEFDHGWLLIRAAQTEPAISVRCEGIDKTSLAALEKQLDELLAPE